MHLILYHTHPSQEPAQDVLARAAARGRQRRRSLLWDILLLLLLIIPCTVPVLPDALPQRCMALLLPCAVTAALRCAIQRRLYRGIVTTMAGSCLRSAGLLITACCTADGLIGTPLPAVHTLLHLCAAVYMVLRIRRMAPRQKKSSLPGILIFLLLAGCFLFIPDWWAASTGHQPSSAMTSTSTSAPLGRSLTATQLLAGLPVIYLP